MTPYCGIAHSAVHSGHSYPHMHTSQLPPTNSLGHLYTHLQVMYMCIILLFSLAVTIMYFPQVINYAVVIVSSQITSSIRSGRQLFFYTKTTIWQILIHGQHDHHSKDSTGTFQEHSGWPQGHKEEMPYGIGLDYFQDWTKYRKTCNPLGSMIKSQPSRNLLGDCGAVHNLVSAFRSAFYKWLLQSYPGKEDSLAPVICFVWRCTENSNPGAFWPTEFWSIYSNAEKFFKTSSSNLAEE